MQWVGQSDEELFWGISVFLTIVLVLWPAGQHQHCLRLCVLNDPGAIVKLLGLFMIWPVHHLMRKRQLKGEALWSSRIRSLQATAQFRWSPKSNCDGTCLLN